MLPGPGAPPGERDLQLACRLDWRFLLPDPVLGRVAFIGPREGTLLPALQRFCDRLTVVPGYTAAAGGAERLDPVDLAVLRSRFDHAVLAAVTSLIRQGGHLYWELDPSPGPGVARDGLAPLSSGRGRFLLRHVRALRDLGFDDVEAHWHRPNFEQCREMIHLDPTSVEYAMSQRSGAPRLLRGPVRWLARHGWLAAVARCVSVVAHKP